MKFSNKVCSFTGYRLKKLYESLGEQGLDELKAVLTTEISKLLDENFSVFQCGMALGADMLFADVVLEYKKKYPSIRFNAFIPCLGQEKRWNEAHRSRYRLILEEADEVKYVSETEYFDGCMNIRNKRLVDTCDLLLAVYDGKRGGTMQTVEHAKKQGKAIRIIDPATLLRVTVIEPIEDNTEQGRLL